MGADDNIYGKTKDVWSDYRWMYEVQHINELNYINSHYPLTQVDSSIQKIGIDLDYIVKGVQRERDLVSEVNYMYKEFKEIYFKNFEEDNTKFEEYNKKFKGPLETRIKNVMHSYTGFYFGVLGKKSDDISSYKIKDKMYYNIYLYDILDTLIYYQGINGFLIGDYKRKCISEEIIVDRSHDIGRSLNYMKYFQTLKGYYVSLYAALNDLKELTGMKEDKNLGRHELFKELSEMQNNDMYEND